MTVADPTHGTLPAEGATTITERSEALNAVGHPVRLRMLDRLRDGPASVPELADAAAVHENTVRAHVVVLEQGGLLASETRPGGGPGRPGVQYRLTADGERLDQDFLGVAELLAAVIGRISPEPELLRSIGREWGRYLLGRPGRYDLSERIPDVLRRLGFDAELVDDRVQLSGCPCPIVSADRPELVCQLATGVLEGVLGGAGADQAVGEGSHDPARRRCHITLIDVAAKARQRA